MAQIATFVLLGLLAGCTRRENAEPTDRDHETSEPSSQRFQVIVNRGGGLVSTSMKIDTLEVVARPGESIAPVALGRAWPDFLQTPPLIFEGMDGPDRAWVRCSRDVAPVLGSRSDERPTSRVLVSTTTRSFSTLVIDGGMVIGVRLIAPAAYARTNAPPFQVTSIRRRQLAADAMDWNLTEIRAAGIFRLGAITPDPVPDSTSAMWHSRPVILHFVCEEIWVGSGLHPGQTLHVHQRESSPFLAGWFHVLGNRGIRIGTSRVLLLGVVPDGPHAGEWLFDPLRSYRFDRDRGLAIDMAGHATPVRPLADDLRRRLWCLSHVNVAMVQGVARHATSGNPARGVRVWVEGQSPETVTDSTGSFELMGVPIGIHELCFESPCGKAARPIEFSDEFTESLGVALPFDGPPCAESVVQR